MKTIHMLTAALLATSLAAPAAAQMKDKGSMMMSDSKMMKMSAMDMKMMKSCKRMSHKMMMKSRGCMKMMKMHPDMMK